MLLCHNSPVTNPKIGYLRNAGTRCPRITIEATHKRRVSGVLLVWNGNQDFRPLTVLALHRQGSSQPLGPLAHAKQAKVSTALMQRAVGIEATSIVLDGKLDLLWMEIQGDENLTGASMLHAVRYGLLTDAKEMMTGGCGKTA